MGKHRGNPDRPEPDYDVGYGKPPKEHRFKAGVAGRGGRKKRVMSIAEEAAELLRSMLNVTEAGVQRRYSARTLILKAMLAKAVKGDLKAADFLFRLDNGEQINMGRLEAEMLTPEDHEMLADFVRRSSSSQSNEDGPSSPPSSDDGV